MNQYKNRNGKQKIRSGSFLGIVEGKMQTMFYDIESNEYITINQLFSEYMENRKNNPEEFDYTFCEYIKNCLTENNGTLEFIQIKSE